MPPRLGVSEHARMSCLPPPWVLPALCARESTRLLNTACTSTCCAQHEASGRSRPRQDRAGHVGRNSQGVARRGWQASQLPNNGHNQYRWPDVHVRCVGCTPLHWETCSNHNGRAGSQQARHTSSLIRQGQHTPSGTHVVAFSGDMPTALPSSVSRWMPRPAAPAPPAGASEAAHHPQPPHCGR